MRSNQEHRLKEVQEAKVGPQCTRLGTIESRKPRSCYVQGWAPENQETKVGR